MPYHLRCENSGCDLSADGHVIDRRPECYGCGAPCSGGEREGIPRLVALFPGPADVDQLHLERH